MSDMSQIMRNTTIEALALGLLVSASASAQQVPPQPQSPESQGTERAEPKAAASPVQESSPTSSTTASDEPAEATEPAKAPGAAAVTSGPSAPLMELSNEDVPSQEEPVQSQTAPAVEGSPPPMPAASALPVTPEEPPTVSGPDLSVRELRRFSVAAELGWNTLAGLGVNAGYNLAPWLSLDGGFGLSMVGLKGGLRIRANMLESNWTPIIAAGLLYGAGSGGDTVEVEGTDDKAEMRIRRSYYIQSVVGANYTGDTGFTATLTAGYAVLLRDNAEFVSGSREVFDDVRPFLGSGVVIGVSLGYAFATD